ncbi:MAG TPA: DUF2335 domain-containing protein [Longimicrobium sp.]|nr:DUF2335 domain-containing protein [Longimicrobium sp.]
MIEEEIAQAGKVEITKYFTGPLPSPDDLYEYDQALPGTADRIITMAEREALHRQSVEQRLLVIQGRNSALGIAAGFTVGIAGIVGGVYAVVHGADIAGGGVALTALAALAGIFVTQQRAERKEAAARQEA